MSVASESPGDEAGADGPRPRRMIADPLCVRVAEAILGEMSGPGAPSEHARVMHGLTDVLRSQEWPRLADYIHADATMEFPQSRERFRGIDNIRAQFENYRDFDPGLTEFQEVIGEPKAYALSPSYTVIGVDGSGDRGTAIIRARYPDGTFWYVIIIFELRDGVVARSRFYFAQDFDAPEWRAPYREAP